MKLWSQVQVVKKSVFLKAYVYVASGRGTPIAMDYTSLLRSNKVLFSIPHLWAFINPAKGEEIEKGCSVFGKRSCSVRSFCTHSDFYRQFHKQNKNAR